MYKSPSSYSLSFAPDNIEDIVSLEVNLFVGILQSSVPSHPFRPVGFHCLLQYHHIMIFSLKTQPYQARQASLPESAWQSRGRKPQTLCTCSTCKHWENTVMLEYQWYWLVLCPTVEELVVPASRPNNSLHLKDWITNCHIDHKWSIFLTEYLVPLFKQPHIEAMYPRNVT